MRAQCGEYVRAERAGARVRARRARRRRATRGRSRSMPTSRAAATSSCSRARWTSLRANVTVPPWMKRASMPSLARRGAEFDDGVLEHVALVVEGVAAVAPDDAGVAQRKESRGPAAVATRRAEAADLLLEHRDAKRRGRGAAVRARSTVR